MITLSPKLLSDAAAILAATFTGGSLRIFAGTRPAGAGYAETGTLLGIATLNADPSAGLQFQVFANGFGTTALSRVAFRALASGDATWFRLVAPGDTGGDSNTAPRIDGSIGAFDDPGDMAWLTTAVAAGGTYTIDSFNYFIHPMGPTP